MAAVNASAIAMCGSWPEACSRTRDGVRRAGARTDTPQPSAARASRLSSAQSAEGLLDMDLDIGLAQQSGPAQSMRESSCPLAQLLLGQIAARRPEGQLPVVDPHLGTIIELKQS